MNFGTGRRVRSVKRWYEAVCGLENYENKLILKSFRERYISRNNCLTENYKKIIKKVNEVCCW
jgi:NADPH-dependent 7-cyano-7-deazaguanine reductase QueF